jgi:hypothetical protein
VGALTVFFGSGGGAFTSTIVFTTGAPTWVESADLDSNGLDDLVVALSGPESVAVILGTPQRAFPTLSFPSGAVAPSGLAVGDVDGDGSLDVMVADSGSAAVTLLRGNAGTVLGAPERRSLPAPVNHVALADVSADGLLDVVAAHPDARIISILLGDGLGGLEPRPLSFDSDGRVEAAIPIDLAPPNGAAEIALPGETNRTSLLRFRPNPVAAALRGTVDAGRTGVSKYVLFVNARSGGLTRRVYVRPGAPLSVSMNLPPATATPPGTAAYALYAWRGEPNRNTVRALPLGLGSIAFPMPLAPQGTPQPIAIWNNAGFTGRLGAPTLPSAPAPSVVFGTPTGLPAGRTITLQGVIADPGAPNGRAAVTNGVVIRAR